MALCPDAFTAEQKLRNFAHYEALTVRDSSLAAGTQAVIAGLAGARQRDGCLSFAPRLPEPLSRIAFPFAFQGRVLRVEITASRATYELRDGAPLQVEHWGTELLLTPGARSAGAIPPAPAVATVRQPAGRAPSRRQPFAQPTGHER